MIYNKYVRNSFIYAFSGHLILGHFKTEIAGE